MLVGGKTKLKRIDGQVALQDDHGVPVRIRWLATFWLQSRTVDPDTMTFVVVSRPGSSLGLVVSTVFGEEEVVVKRLPWNLRRIAGISGAVILGDGSLAVVADVPRLVQKRVSGRASAPSTTEACCTSAGRR